MLAAQFIFAIVAFLLVYNGSSVVNLGGSLSETLQVISIALSAGGFYLGTLLFKKKILQAREVSDGVKHKFDLYRNACILQWALIEAPAYL
ncbi:MAG: hypothetical protein JWP81_2157 [Ferruginibacter sp.]|nr:hypothetical protein [Ferruginibacter sp.]